MTLLSNFHLKGKQEQAAIDPNPAIAVTAGAGSGKTLSLVGRYLHLLEQGYPLRSILAITFTEKAAREMRARVRKAPPPPKPVSPRHLTCGRKGFPPPCKRNPSTRPWPGLPTTSNLPHCSSRSTK